MLLCGLVQACRGCPDGPSLIKRCGCLLTLYAAGRFRTLRQEAVIREHSGALRSRFDSVLLALLLPPLSAKLSQAHTSVSRSLSKQQSTLTCT